MTQSLANTVVLGLSLWACTPTADAADAHNADLALLADDKNSFRPGWIAGGSFAEALRDDFQEYTLTPFRRPVPGKNTVNVGYVRAGYGKTLRLEFNPLAFSPHVVIRPIIILEELQDLFAVYQTNKLEESVFGNGTAPSDENMTTPPKLIVSLMAVSLSPYHHGAYGLYVQIRW